MDQKFLICEHCGNIVAAVKESGVPVVCCGQKMKEIIPGTVEASRVIKFLLLLVVLNIQWFLNIILNGLLFKLNKEIK